MVMHLQSLIMAHRDLGVAKAAKKDEFYTQLVDIENELRHYREHFRDKVVLCNCDDPYESNFFKYFALNFNSLALKKLIATCYDGSPVVGSELPLLFSVEDEVSKKVAYKVEITEVADMNGDGCVDLTDVRILLQNDKNVLTTLKQHGDFRSAECVALLKEADIVCTNPPFSLFREYIAQLMEYGKKFLIIGRMTVLHYKEVFPLLQQNKLWVGYGFNLSMVYKTPYANTEEANQKYVKSKGYDPNKNFIKVPAVLWLTNLDHKKRHEEVVLYKQYSPEEYPKYDNYDAINVDSVMEIPYDFDGVMGVPDTLLGQFNPKQFTLVGLGSGNLAKKIGVTPNYRGRTDVALTINGKHKCPYSRILIKRKK